MNSSFAESGRSFDDNNKQQQTAQSFSVLGDGPHQSERGKTRSEAGGDE